MTEETVVGATNGKASDPTEAQTKDEGKASDTSTQAKVDGTPAAAQKTETPTTDNTIPQDRFNVVNEERKVLKAELKALKAKAQEVEAAAEQAKSQAELDQAKKDKDLQKQIDLLTVNLETEQTKAAEAVEKARQAEIASIKARVAAKHSLPAEFIDRLVGDTEGEIETDVQKLLEAMPKITPATQTDGTAGQNSSTPIPVMTETEIREMAVTYGVIPEHLMNVMTKQ